MHAYLLLLGGAILLAPGSQPRIEKPLAGPLGLAQQATLNQIDILVDLWTRLPPELRSLAAPGVTVAQRAHEVAVRNLIVVERGVVTADYRRWKLQRAILALVRADRELDRILATIVREAPDEVVVLVNQSRERARLEVRRAVSALRELDGGMRWWGGAGVAPSALFAGLVTGNEARDVSKRVGVVPASSPAGSR